MRERNGINPAAKPSGTGCVECLARGGWWLHLRRCAECGHIGCCDTSPNQHASKHHAATDHPIITSFEPDERWFYDYRTEGFITGPKLHAPHSHPLDQPVPGPAGAVPSNWKTLLSRIRGRLVGAAANRPRVIIRPLIDTAEQLLPSRLVVLPFEEPPKALGGGNEVARFHRFQKGEQNGSKRKSPCTSLERPWLALEGWQGLCGAGYYLNELTVPVRALMKEGYEITFANPKGNTPHLDEFSATAQFFGGDEARLQDYRKFHDSLDGLKNPARISDVIASGLDQYDAVFAPGGHGPMIDLLDDPDAATVYRHFHSTSKPTAVLCHGPISLLSAHPNAKEVVGALKAGDAARARTKAQGWIYSGYKLTIFSTAEEQQREPLEIGGKVLFYPDFALRTAGADVSVVAPWGSYVLEDREVISGQNPFSDEALLKLLLPALNVKKK